MPKVVDWEERRDEVLDATWRVIARDGIKGATMRAIAKEVGYSSGVLAHYFNDKDDILASALILSHRRVAERMDKAVSNLDGLDALRAVMLEALPLDDHRLREAQIEVSFWGRTLGDARLERLQNSEFDRFSSRLRSLLDRAHELGQLRSGLDLDLATHECLIFVDGVSAERVLYPQRNPPARQLELLEGLLRGIGR